MFSKRTLKPVMYGALLVLVLNCGATARGQANYYPGKVNRELKLAVTDPACKIIVPEAINQSKWSKADKSLLKDAHRAWTHNMPEIAASKYKYLVYSHKSYEMSYNFGLSLAACGKLEHAKDALQRAVELNPRFKPAQKMLSLMKKKARKAAEEN